MRPYLYALNLNGMLRDGERRGRKIVPLGQGDLDLDLLKTIRDSGYRGPIGIIGHTQDDAEERLRDNLDGLEWLVKQLDGQPPGPHPKPRTYVPPLTSKTRVNRVEAINAARAATPQDSLSNNVSARSPTVNPPQLEYNAQVAVDLVADAIKHGDVQRGMAVFCSPRFACLGCHQIGKEGGAVGPALTDVGRRLKVEEIAESLLWPKREIKPEFSAWQILLNDGRSLQAYKRSETSEMLQLFDLARQQSISLAKADVEDQHNVGTLMPDGLAAAMTATQRCDLVRFLHELGHTPGLENEVHSEGTIAEFSYDRGPLDPAAWPLWQHPVNRDRVYDFYTKEAIFFRQQTCRPHLLPAFPGLDGGKFGHWGNQNEDVWKDDRWNRTDLGTVLSGVFHGPDTVVPKGVCVRLGEHGEMATCFNPETLNYEALWQGDFLKFSDVRHGFMDGLAPSGDMLPRPAAIRPEQPFVYHGFYRLGRRVVFAYQIGDVELLDSPWIKDGKFERDVAPAAEHPLRDALRGGPPQWPGGN